MQRSIDKIDDKPGTLVSGLDTWRLIAALVVAASHGARFPIHLFVGDDHALGTIILFVVNRTVNGTAAVALFFIISGFCIHNANIRKRHIAFTPFLIRRWIRIGLPLLAMIFIAHALGAAYVHALDSILWSIYCEIIYYSLYPLLIPLFFKYGSVRIMLISLAISLTMAALHPDLLYLTLLGPTSTWLLCAPLWIMGCVLAEHRQRLQAMTRFASVWFYRAGAIAYVWGSALILEDARFAIGFPRSIWIFGLFSLFWLAREMDHARTKGPARLLEKLGLAAYSIYLTHKVAITLFQAYTPHLAPLPHWLGLISTVAAVSWAFYYFVEQPSHRLARSWREGKGDSAAIPSPLPPASRSPYRRATL